MDRKEKIYIIQAKIQKQRLKHMKEAAKKRSIEVTEQYTKDVTHIVTEFKDISAVLRELGIADSTDLSTTEVVSVEWFTDCMKANKVIDVLEKHKIKAPSQQGHRIESRQTRSQPMPEYACQRATPLKHNNEKFTKVLEILEKHAELRDGDHDYSRALAFRRVSCVLKCLPVPLTNMEQLRNVLNIGEHSKRVIQEVLEEGCCGEVETILNDPWFKKMELFTGVFGIGPSTAKTWIERGWQTIAEAQQGHVSSDWRVQWGLSFHDDLTTSVTTQEANYIFDIVQRHVRKLLPGAIMQLTGGFRRGKQIGHDVDILITHPVEGKEIGLLTRLIHSLQSHDVVLCGKQEKSSYSDDVLTRDSKLSMRGQLDHFEKWLGMLKVPKSVREHSTRDRLTVLYDRNENSTQEEELNKGAYTISVNGARITTTFESLEDINQHVTNEKKCNINPSELCKEPHDWLARRVDLIISPYSQYYYALVGWTGNKQFNRDLRWYAQRELNMKLTSHGLYDFNKGQHLPAESEQDVFDHLHITYREPDMRNC